ncbi:DinB family protein [Streptomyces sp. NPDC001700]
MATDRPAPPLLTGERETLRGFLDFHRATLAMKCDGLSDKELRRHSIPPSTLSLLDLVRHMTEVERTWFRITASRENIPLVWSDQRDYQVAYDATTSTRTEASGAWQREVAHVHSERWGKDTTLRLVMTHVLLEYARHNGHADFLREGIDGTVGP